MASDRPGDIARDITSPPLGDDVDPIAQALSPGRLQLPDVRALLEAELARAATEELHVPSSLGVGEIVLTCRELAGLRQRGLASVSGISQPALANVETGSRVPKLPTLMRAAEAAGFQLVVGLRRPGAREPVLLGALSGSDDGLADFLPIVRPSPFTGPADR